MTSAFKSLSIIVGDEENIHENNHIVKLVKLKHLQEVPRRMWYNEVTNGLNILSLLLNSCIAMHMRNLLIWVAEFPYSQYGMTDNDFLVSLQSYLCKIMCAVFLNVYILVLIRAKYRFTDLPLSILGNDDFSE